MEMKTVVLLIVAISLQVANSKPNGGLLDLEKFFEDYDENSSQERIVGGYAVPDGEYVSYQVSMQYLSKSGKQHHFCGGSIISPTRILTAAHCVKGANASRISVVGGVIDVNDNAGQRSNVMSYDIHENYQELVTSDIAILSIEPALELDGERMSAINVVGSEKIGGGQQVVLTGWGALWHFGTGPFSRHPTRLQKLSYKTITNEQCKQTMSQLTEMEICALEHFGKGACNGDSGGPLVMGSGDSLRQVGVVSYGTALCASNAPDVYTRVSMFEDWINERMN